MPRLHLPLLCALLLTPPPARAAALSFEQHQALSAYFENNAKFVDVAKQPLELLESSRGAAFLSRYSDALLVVRLSNDLAEARDTEAFQKMVEKLEDVAMERLFPGVKRVLGVVGWAKTGMELLKDLVVEPAVLDAVMDVYADNRRTLDPEDAIANLRAYGLVRTKALEQFRRQYGEQAFTKEDRTELLPRWKARFDRFLPAWVETQYQLRVLEEARRALRVKRAQAERELAELDLALHAMLAEQPCPEKAARAADGRCRCAEGHRWNADATACVVDREAQVAAQDKSCASRNGKAYWDDGAGRARCQCLAGHRLADDRSGCVVDKAAQVARADCSHVAGSRAYWDEEVGRPRCRSCNPGFRWRDARSLECEPEPQPEPSDAEAEAAASAAVAQIEQAFGQLLAADAAHRERTREIEREWGRGRAALAERRIRSEVDRAQRAAPAGPSPLDACVACVNGLITGSCYVRVPRLAGWGLCLSCEDGGGVKPEDRFLDTVKCPVCKGAGWKLESFKAYRHN